jgi:hypothetical protein
MSEKNCRKMGFYGLAYIIKVEQCEYIKKSVEETAEREETASGFDAHGD